MDFWFILYIVDWFLFGIVALAVLYMLIYTIASLFYTKRDVPKTKQLNRFIILIPSYNNPGVIYTVKSVLAQSYPMRLFDVTVISDHNDEMTNFRLAQEPVTLLTPNFEKSTKAKAMKLAINNLPQFKIYDIAIVLDGGSIVDTNFLEQMNEAFEAAGTKVFQAHRISRNRDSIAARMGAVFEEINNSIFRRGHIALGLSASICGGGYAMEFNWFKENVFKLKTPWEVKEWESLLMRQNVFVDFFDDIFVYDEKKRTPEEFNRERLTWIKAQIHAAFRNIHYLPGAILNRQYNRIDKVIQWLLIPRMLMMAIIVGMSLILPIIYTSLVFKWWALFAITLLICAIATPDYLVDDHWESTFFKSPLVLMKSIPGLSGIANYLDDITFNTTSKKKDKKKKDKKKK
jgi:cellulose synthase/poly-beta-1,6-N-acetylglucosamine synthase-like glycosyltransferase